MNLTKYRHIAFVLAAGGLLTLVLILLVAQPGRAAGPWYVAPDGDDGNDCLSPGAPCATINGVIGKASPGDTIYVSVGTYTGTGDEVVLLDKDVTLSGGWGSSFTTQSGTSTIDGEDARRGISVNSGVTAIAERFTVQNGSASSGGGIRNEGTLVLNNSTVSGNTTSGSYCGGGIINYYGTLTLNDSTVSDNTASYDSRPQRGGGGINNYHGTLTLNNSTISGNSVTWTSYPLSGGGIYNLSSGTLTLSNSTISGNTAWQGSGISSSGGGNVTLNNSTVSGNMGDGIQLNVGTLALGNSTVSRNSGHGISTSSNGTVTLHNSVLAENASGDCSGTIGSEGYNLLGDISGCAFTPSTGDLIDMDANLGPLIGSPAYHPLLQGSPAIDAVPLDQCTLDADQRGVARPQGPACDMGAYEYTSPGPAASVLAFDGTPQRTPPLSTFVAPFRALVLDSIGSPVSGETVTFSAPASGASGTFADSDTATTTAVTDESGVATAAMFTANGLAGSYVVTAEVSGIVTSANFLLTNVGWYASPTGDDANDCQAPATPCATIDGPLAKPGFVSGDTVLVATGTYTGTGDEVVLVDQDVRLSGGWDAVFTVQSGVSSTIDGEWARRGVTVNGGVIAVIERFTVHHGTTGGGGIHNNGTLTLNDCAVSGNIDGGIRTEDTLTVRDSTLTLNNSTVSDNTGGGIYSSAAGSVILNKSAVSGNSGHGVHNNSGTMILKDSTVSGNADGGMRNGGTLILNDSTVSGNRDGGIYNEGNLILNNSTVSGNTAGWGAGIYNRDGPVTLNNSTVSSNTARNSGGGILNDGFYDATATLHNSILAGNSAFETGPDCAGTIGTAGHNLIGDTSGCTFSPDTGDLTNVNPDLGKLIGIPGYHPLLSGSPAIDAVPPDECTLATDQRGVARPQGPACDMGAYEYTNPGLAAGIVAAGGTPQRTPPFFAFDTPLQAAVLDSIGSPVPGATVTFSALASGASGTFANGDTTTTTAVTDESGVATAAMFTANGLAGSYAVTAEVSGIVTPASFLLTNVGWYASGIGHDANDCQTPTTPCATIVGPLAKPGYVSGDTVLVATGIYTGAGDEVVLLDRDVTLSGGWDAAYAVQDGVSTIDGEGARRGVTVNSGVTSIIERFTMQNGSAGWPGGGGIYNDGTLTLNSSIVSGNTDDGIYNEDILTLNNGTVSGNAGDGIRNDGILAFNGSTVNDNSGRGITNNGDGRLVLNNSTVSGNTGGGIYNAGDLTLNSCTVSDNVTGSIAGGIYNDDYGGGTVSLRNSILAGNRATEAGPDCSGTIGSLGYNLVGDTSDCGFTPAPGDLLDVDPRLFVLVGSPGYHPLRPGSPAIDAGNPDGCADHLGNPFDTDQRGTPRPLDGDGDGTAICDMGAYEVDPEHPIRQLFLPIILRNYCPDFFDDFSNPASGWEVVNDSYVRSEYLNGEYRILTKRAGYFYLFRAPTCNRQNYTVKADARWVGTPGASYGLVFGITSGFEQYYLFDINTDYRKYDLVRRDPGGFTQIVWPTYSAAINGGTASNHLKVTRNGDQITLEVNGTVLGTWSDGTIGGRTWAGLVTNPYSGNPTSDARFDNFSMASLPGSGASAQEPSDVTAEEGQPTVPNARRVPASIDMGW